MHHLQWSDDPVRSARTLPAPLPSQGRARLGNELGGHCSAGAAALPPWHISGVPRGRGGWKRMPSPKPLRVEVGATSSLLTPGTGRSSNSSCALQRSRRFAPRARRGSPPLLSTWPCSGSRRTLYHPSLEEAATVPTTTWQWDMLIEATSSRLGCHNIDSTRQCVVAHKKCAIHSLACLLLDVINPVM